MFRYMISVLSLYFMSFQVSGQDSIRSIHVFVALCDNEHQGIVPVAPILGNGEDPKNNLYWGATYGVRTLFEESKDWKLVSTMKKPDNFVLERCVFQKDNTYLIADAYRGNKIRKAITVFLEAAYGNNKKSITLQVDPESLIVGIGGYSNLIAYVGHNGLMDFELTGSPMIIEENHPDLIILACMSKAFFQEVLKNSNAGLILWTNGLMAPEAYVLKDVIGGWMLNENDEKIHFRAAKAYNKYQKCGLKAAKNLFVIGR